MAAEETPSHPTKDEHVLLKDCRWCASKIPASASICTHCNSHQSRLRTALLYLASVTGVAALAASAFTFVLSNSQEAYKQLFWSDEIALSYLNILPGHDITAIVANRGDGPVFVSHIEIYWRGGNESVPFLKVIEPHEFSVVENKEEQTWPFRGFWATTDGLFPEEMLKSTVNNVAFESGCLVTNFYSEDADDIRRMNSTYNKLGGKLVVDSAEFEVHYFSLHDGQKRANKIKGVATFLARKGDQCNSLFQ